MSSQCFIMSLNGVVSQNVNNKEAVPQYPKEKVMSYEEKTLGSTPFYKCEACPYMALAEDDIKFHLFTVHPDLAKTNGLAENVQIQCPGCADSFDAEETLRNHLRNHHKMGIKDVKKMIKSLVQIALKDAKLKKEDKGMDKKSPLSIIQDRGNVKIPQVIEIIPDVQSVNTESLPQGVAFISVDEMQKMATPNFEQVDPKEIIKEASISIVYTNEVPPQYVNVTNASTSSSACNVIQVSSVTPDLISSIQPKTAGTAKLSSPTKEIVESKTQTHLPTQSSQRKKQPLPTLYQKEITDCSKEKCSIDNCNVKLKDLEKLNYHRSCHQSGTLKCQECGSVYADSERLHTHLWRTHGVDMELPTCEICDYKTYRRHRLNNIHMRCHGTARNYTCSICFKAFKNVNQLSKHKLTHKRETKQCYICQNEFRSMSLLKVHLKAVHEKVKPYKCSHCEYTAARRNELQLHIRSHTGDKPYACDQCSYRASDHNAMRRHKMKHNNEAAYKCKHCPYTAIQSTVFTSHMISKHPNINSNDLHRCPYCKFVTVNKDKYVAHLTTHTDKEGVQLLIEMTKGVKNKPSWTIPSDATTKPEDEDKKLTDKQDKEECLKAVNSIPIEVYDCDSLSEGTPQDYPKSYCTTPDSTMPQPDFGNQTLVNDLGKDDNNSDCLISESSNDTLMERHQYSSQHPLQNMTYDNTQSNIHGFLNTSVTLDQNLLQNNSVSSLAMTHSVIDNPINNNMSNFLIRLPPAPKIPVRNHFMLKPVDNLPLPMTKVMGPIITPTQILPVPSSSNSPINMTSESEGVPRKKPKISVKSNLILKGPDPQINMFHSQQKMAFRRLEDNERFGLSSPVTFNNLITTQFMQLQPEPVLSESPSDIMQYSQETMLDSTTAEPVDNMASSQQIFTFNQQMNVNNIPMLPPPQKIQTSTDPSYIKLETTIKQNTQSPGLDRICANMITNQAITREYKASPPLEDIHKNMNEIKNEVRSDPYYTMALNNSATNPTMMDQYLMDSIVGEQYPNHLDLSAVVMPEVTDQQNDVIEIDDNSDDTKLLPRFDMNFPLESLYLMHNDFHFLENDMQQSNLSSDISVNEMNRIVTEVPVITQKDNIGALEGPNGDYNSFVQGNKDPMMNTSVRPTTNKINVKNIELMKN